METMKNNLLAQSMGSLVGLSFGLFSISRRVSQSEVWLMFVWFSRGAPKNNGKKWGRGSLWKASCVCVQ